MNAGGESRLSGLHLVAHSGHDLRRRADESKSSVDACLCEVVSLGEEAVARMNGIDVVLFGDLNDLGYVQVGLDRWQTSTDQIRFIGLLSVHLHTVLLRVDRHGANAKLGTCSKYSDGDFTCVEREGDV